MENPLDELVDEAGDPPAEVWKIAGAVAGLAGAVAARKLLNGLRGRAGRRGQPSNGRTSWLQALVWTLIIGVAASVGRVFAERVVADIWMRRRHRPAAETTTGISGKTIRSGTPPGCGS